MKVLTYKVWYHISVISHDSILVNTRQHVIPASRMHPNMSLGCSLTNARRFLEQRKSFVPSSLGVSSDSPRLLPLSFSLLARITKSPNTSRIMHAGASGMMRIRVRVHA